ncbi:MAG: cytidylate kinase-like family protein, partial [Ruminococcus sp.]|nr:cytidylate kinase-like family protein [Ruminococcus sp.]
GDEPQKAKENIRRSDEARASYYKNISGQSWGSRHNYELLLDGSVGVDASVNIICDYIEGKERKGKERKGKERKGKERKGKERKGK